MRNFKVGTKRYIYDNRAAEDDVCLAHILAVTPHPDYPKDSVITYRFWSKYKRYYFYGAITFSRLLLWEDYIKKVIKHRKEKKQ